MKDLSINFQYIMFLMVNLINCLVSAHLLVKWIMVILYYLRIKD